METTKSVIPSIHQRDFLVSVDIKDTYLHVPIFPIIDFLWFTLRPLHKQLMVLPFGFGCSLRFWLQCYPRCFLSMSIIGYLDNLLLRE